MSNNTPNRDTDVDTSVGAVFRAFEVNQFLPWRPWRDLERILRTNGGAYGLSGPRGSGKTWLMHRAVKAADDSEGVGLWFPAPSNYDAQSFLATLADSFASQVQIRYQWNSPRWHDKAGRISALFLGLFLIIVGVSLLYTFGRNETNRIIGQHELFRELKRLQFALIERYAEHGLNVGTTWKDYEAATAKLRAAREDSADEEALALAQDEVEHTKFRWQSALEAARSRPTQGSLTTGGSADTAIAIPPRFDVSEIMFVLLILLAIGLTSVGGLVVLAFPYARNKSRRAPNQLCLEADRLRKRIRFATSLTDASELTAGTNKTWGIFKRASQQELVERPFTITSLVQEFRSLLASTNRTTQALTVVAVDELDKLHDSDIARQLLRDIKGIFEVAGVHFLISISDEARASLSLGQLRSRDEFHSSFYSVIDAGHRSPSECAALVDARAPQFEQHIAERLGILAGGIPRELLRMVDVTSRTKDASLRCVLSQLLENETRSLLNQLLMCNLSETAETALYEEFKNLSVEEFAADTTSLRDELLRLSNPDWLKDSDLPPDVRQAWERLILRFAIAAVLVDEVQSEQQKISLDDLQRVMIMAERSAGVARLILVQYLDDTEDESC